MKGNYILHYATKDNEPFAQTLVAAYLRLPCDRQEAALIRERKQPCYETTHDTAYILRNIDATRARDLEERIDDLNKTLATKIRLLPDRPVRALE